MAVLHDPVVDPVDPALAVPLMNCSPLLIIAAAGTVMRSAPTPLR